jgi:hypothetical protein
MDGLHIQEQNGTYSQWAQIRFCFARLPTRAGRMFLRGRAANIRASGSTLMKTGGPTGQNRAVRVQLVTRLPRAREDGLIMENQ